MPMLDFVQKETVFFFKKNFYTYRWIWQEQETRNFVASASDSRTAAIPK